jgi:hypothetical protein
MEASISACASTAGTGEEPGAVVPHAGICAGGGWVTALPTATVACIMELLRAARLKFI